MLRNRAVLTALVCFACLPAVGSPKPSNDAYRKRVIKAVKTSEPPTIDGDLGDAVWKSAPVADTFIDGNRGGPVTDQTKVWIVYDASFIYIAFHCFDSNPNGIIARETVRDSRYGNYDNPSEDSVEVLIDPYTKYRFEDVTRFSVNAIGTPSARISGGRASKVEWKGDWSAAAKRVQDGWTAEMKIPWSILNYRFGKDPTTIGIDFSRWQEQTKIGSIWSDLTTQGELEYEGRWTGVQLPPGVFHPKLSVLPYLMPEYNSNSLGLRSGVDARLSFTPEMTAVGSINPDFGTIEGAVESISFSRTEQYIPEKRPFFLEGRDYLSMGDDYAIGSYFYSYRIPTFDVGAKVYGKLSPSDSIGVLQTIDFNNSANMVAKYNHTFSPTSAATFFLTQRSETGDNNTLGAAGGYKRWGKFGVNAQMALTGGDGAGGGAKELELFHNDKQGYASIQYTQVAPNFVDANGLINYTDYKGFHAFYNTYMEWRKGTWRNYWLGFEPQYNWHTDGKPFRRGVNLFTGIQNKKDWSINASIGYNKYDDQTDFTYGTSFTANSSNRFRRWGISWTGGMVENEPYSYIGPWISYRVLRKMDVAYSGGIQSLQGVTQQHILTLSYEMSPTRSFGGRIVSQDSGTNWYVSYRSAGASGTEMFFILGDPNAEKFVKKMAFKMVFAI